MAGTLGGYGEKYRHISLKERDRIAEMKSLGHTVTEIAEALSLCSVPKSLLQAVTSTTDPPRPLIFSSSSSSTLLIVL